MFYILSRNENGSVSYANPEETGETKQLKQLLSMICNKVDERFGSTSQAFRFFDSDYNQKVTFNEFV